MVRLRNFLMVSTSALVEPVISEASTRTIPCNASALAFWSSWKLSPSENHLDRSGSPGNSHAHAVDLPMPCGPTRTTISSCFSPGWKVRVTTPISTDREAQLRRSSLMSPMVKTWPSQKSSRVSPSHGGSASSQTLNGSTRRL